MKTVEGLLGLPIGTMPDRPLAFQARDRRLRGQSQVLPDQSESDRWNPVSSKQGGCCLWLALA
jgi:hypothetical protein